jgi:hypothetical protein
LQFFANNGQETLRLCKEIENKFCAVELFQELGGYFLRHATKKTSAENLLAPGSAVDYFGNCKETVYKKYPKNLIWKHSEESDWWYSKIRRSMLNDRLIQSIRDGIDVTLTNIPIGHDGSLQISRYHLRENKFEGVEKNCIVLSTGQAIGRVEECAWVSTNQCIFNSIYKVIDLAWNDMKTSKQDKLPIFS